MSNTHYLHALDDDTGVETLVVFVIGVGHDSCDNTHPNFDQILEAARNFDEEVLDLFDLEKTVSKRFDRLSDRVTVAHGVIYLDGDPIDSALTRQVVHFLDEGVDDWQPLVNFFEKVMANPNEHSRDMLYGWLAADDTLTITEDGNIIGYKGVGRNADGDYISGFSGHGIVNGEEVNGYLCNNVGNVVEMPRSEVMHDPSAACSVGLHFGTWSYAQGYATSAVLKVEVDPRDVVSVPDHCAQKVRCCRYKVREVAEQRFTTAVAPLDEDTDEEECWECGADLDDCGCEDI